MRCTPGTCALHGTVQRDINSLHKTLPSHNTLQQCKTNICRLHDACKFCNHISRPSCDSKTLWNQKIVHCRMFARHNRANFMHSKVFEILCNCDFEVDICGFFETGVCNMLKLFKKNHPHIVHGSMLFAACCG